MSANDQINNFLLKEVSRELKVGKAGFFNSDLAFISACYLCDLKEVTSLGLFLHL